MEGSLYCRVLWRSAGPLSACPAPPPPMPGSARRPGQAAECPLTMRSRRRQGRRWARGPGQAERRRLKAARHSTGTRGPAGARPTPGARGRPRQSPGVGGGTGAAGQASGGKSSQLGAGGRKETAGLSASGPVAFTLPRPAARRPPLAPQPGHQPGGQRHACGTSRYPPPTSCAPERRLPSACTTWATAAVRPPPPGASPSSSSTLL